VGPQTDQGGGLHVVRESDAHAWVEAWLPGRGWVEADPTPPALFQEAHGRPGLLERLLQHARAALASAWARLVEGGAASFLRHAFGDLGRLALRAAREPLAWLFALAVAAGPRLLRSWRSRRRLRRAADRDAANVPGALRALVREVERRWAAVGRPRPAGRGLLEHARALEEGPAPSLPPAARAGQDIVLAYYRARFGGETPDPAETARLRERLRA
jgi:hypothetical protein